ncbi:MAG: hypothetical protein NTW04_00335 [Elusimicrobia bacterium]|nr:hypothetical protein [Elusimicrobiota bacterium]
MHAMIFLAVFLSIYIGIHYCLWFWTARYFPQLPVSAQTLKIIFLCAALLFPVSMYLLRKFPGQLTSAMAYGAETWMGVSFIWLCIAILFFAAEMLGVPPKHFGPAGLGLLIVLSVFSVWSARKVPEVKNIELQVKNLPPALEGFRIAQVSDIHLGTTARR